MSETTKLPITGSGGTEAAKFTDRELQFLGWAMQSLKSGPPDVRSPITLSACTLTSPDRLRKARPVRRHDQPTLC